MSRVYNFSAGPSMLPVPVLEKAAGELLEYGSTGQSVMEMSHRSAAFEPIIAEAQDLLREVMCIPDNYKVLFLQGGASSQFAGLAAQEARRLSELMKYAVIIISTVPIMCVYPFVQKYFSQGVMIGAIKG